MRLFNLFTAALLFAGSLASSSPAGAAELKGITFADHTTVSGKQLDLNGSGLRLATFLKVKVYVGALYLETPSHDGDQIAASGGIKRVEMVFVRDVGAGKIKDAWAEGCEKNCGPAAEAMKPGIAKLQALTPDMNTGDKMAFDFLPDHVEVSVKGQKAVSIGDKDFSKNLILVWIGHKPPNDELKAGMLGVKE